MGKGQRVLVARRAAVGVYLDGGGVAVGNRNRDVGRWIGGKRHRIGLLRRIRRTQFGEGQRRFGNRHAASARSLDQDAAQRIVFPLVYGQRVFFLDVHNRLGKPAPILRRKPFPGVLAAFLVSIQLGRCERKIVKVPRKRFPGVAILGAHA